MESDQDLLNLEPLPAFGNPPVTEVVLAAQFDPPQGFANAHIGRYWATLGDDWKRAVDARPVNPAVEAFDDGDWEEFRISLRDARQIPASRTQLLTAAGDRMIQIDRHWFTYNWRKMAGDGYPRFAAIQPQFDDYYTKFGQNLTAAGLTAPRANLWEVIYVNKIPQGTVWRGPDDLRELCPGLLGESQLGFASFTEAAGEWVFTVKGWKARLRIVLRCVVENGQRIVRLDLIARGVVAEGSECAATVHQGHDIGHAAIVHGFARITSPEAHQYWERQA